MSSKIVDHNGKQYRVTTIEHVNTEQVKNYTVKWELLGRQQMDLFDV